MQTLQQPLAHFLDRMPYFGILFLLPLLLVALSADPSFAWGFGRGFRSFRGGSRFHLPSRSGSSLFSSRYP
jgi:hypothetical protein